MKFVGTIKTDITWLVVQGTASELDDLIAWTQKNHTMYVIAGKRKEIPHPSDVNGYLQRLYNKKQGIQPYEQRFGFKAPSDALRAKLTLA
jgi:hypothetical protein